MKKLLSVLLVLALVLSLSCVVFADGATTHDLTDAKLTKELTVADGINIDAVNKFTFSFTAVGSDTAPVEDHPTIAAQEVTVGAQSNGKATGELELKTIFKGFNHAGVYVYTVAETTTAINSTENGVTKTLTVDDTTYTVRVYVKNKDDGTEISGITVENNKTKEKVDPTSSGFIFKNEYKEEIASDNGVLTVTKSITGDYADKTKTFPITVKLTIPSTATEADIALAQDSTATLNGTTATASLADGGVIKFTKLPAGTTYTISETQDALYQSKITGDVKTPDSAYVAGDRTEVEGAGPITAAGLNVTIDNNREDVIPTGVIIHNLPYVLLVLVAIAGLVYLVMKKRAHNA